MKDNGPGPCHKGANYLVVETNEHRTLQVHPCGLCAAPFILQVDTGKWLEFEDDDDALRERLRERVEQAIKMRAAGFRHNFPTKDEE